MKRANFFKTLLALIVILALFTSCGFASPKEPTPDPDDGNNGETYAAAQTPEDAPEADEAQQDDPNADDGAYSLGNDSFLVNVDELKAIAEADAFPVKAESSRAVVDAFSGYSYEGNDAVAVTVRNNTDKTIASVTVNLCCYDADNRYIEINASAVSYAQQTIYSVCSWDDLALAPGESQELAVRVRNVEEVSGIQAIVVSYTTADNETADNETVESWSAAIPA